MTQLQKPPEYEQFPCWDIVGTVQHKESEEKRVELFTTIHHAPQPVVEDLVALLRTHLEENPLCVIRSMGGVALRWGKCHCHTRALVRDPEGKLMHALTEDAILTDTGDMRGFMYEKNKDEDEPEEEAVPAWARGLKDQQPN